MSLRLRVGLLVVLGALGWMPVTQAQPAPPPVSDVSVRERLGAQVPQNIDFTDSQGRRARLADYFDGNRPVVLVLAYVRCETLCNLVLRGVADAVRDAPLELGSDYRVVAVSIDPREGPEQLAPQLRRLLQLAGESPSSPSWSFLSGREASIRQLAKSLGFVYQYDERTNQYAHPAVIFILDGDGRIMQYLYGSRYEGDTFGDALKAASRGEAVPTGDGQAPLACFRFDPAKRSHWKAIARFYAIGGLLLIVGVSGGLAILVRRGRRNG